MNDTDLQALATAGAYDDAIAIVGLGAVLPDALDPGTFWQNLLQKRSSITEVPRERWEAESYWDPERTAPDKSYSKIGGWVSGFRFDPRAYRIPPCVADAMDAVQQWALEASSQALRDYGHPGRALDLEHTGVILGTAIGGDRHLDTHARIAFPEFARALDQTPGFRELPAEVRDSIKTSWHERLSARLPPVTEDTMPGELPNVTAGRIANLLDLHGPNFITDAACASSLAALSAATRALREGDCKAVLSGGADRNMAASTFVKFAKIGALSATGSRPFADGADGFVMGEGCAVFLLKRLQDAERDQDRIYAVVRGIGSSSDGRGKGITAPSPKGQALAIRRAWRQVGLDPRTATLVEAHGTSTRVGDATEFETLTQAFAGAARGSIALGSVKSNIGHLKAAAGAAGLLKAVLALYHKVLPPTLNAEHPNPALKIESSPFFLVGDARPWPRQGGPRRAAVSSYGFGGTNFHVVLEEYVPPSERPRAAVVPTRGRTQLTEARPAAQAKAPPAPVLAIGAETRDGLASEVRSALARLESGWSPAAEAPRASVLRAAERLIVDASDRATLQDRVSRALHTLSNGDPRTWSALAGQGVFRGTGPRQGKVAFLFPGQGSQYLNMGRELVRTDREAAAVFDEADRVLAPVLGRRLTEFVWVRLHPNGADRAES